MREAAEEEKIQCFSKFVALKVICQSFSLSMGLHQNCITVMCAKLVSPPPPPSPPPPHTHQKCCDCPYPRQIFWMKTYEPIRCTLSSPRSDHSNLGGMYLCCACYRGLRESLKINKRKLCVYSKFNSNLHHWFFKLECIHTCQFVIQILQGSRKPLYM